LPHATKMQLVKNQTWLITFICTMCILHHIGVPFATILQLHDYNSLIFWCDILFTNCSYFPCFSCNVIAYISCLGTLIAGHYGSNGHDF